MAKVLGERLRRALPARAPVLDSFGNSLVALALALIVGCSPEPQEADAVAPPEAETIAVAEPLVAATPDAAVMEKWARSCALCHLDGEGGAPRVGQVEEWAARIAQGEDVLFAHVVKGLNRMPPLGYCMDCEEADFRALTRYMAKF